MKITKTLQTKVFLAERAGYTHIATSTRLFEIDDILNADIGSNLNGQGAFLVTMDFFYKNYPTALVLNRSNLSKF